MNDIAIKVEDVSKTFKLPHEKNTSIKGALINFRKRDRSYEKQQVLHDISFEIKKGEFFGIVGRNGSGKSTLLKLLAGIYTPDKGSIYIDGKLTPFIELGVGFNPELTGRENVYLNGALLGFSRTDMDEMYDDIVEFAELERFMDQRLKNYSSGMQVRLAFSIAIRAQTDILLIDEVLAVGDASFQNKCYQYFEKLKEEKKTIILVTHDMGAVRQFCDKALSISNGHIQHIGTPEEISKIYERANYATDGAVRTEADDPIKLRVTSANGKVKDSFEYGESISMEVAWPKEVKVDIVGVVLYKGQEAVFATNTIDQKVDLSSNKVVLNIAAALGSGRYRASATVFGATTKDVLGSTNTDPHFTMYGQPSVGKHRDQWAGIHYLENSWKDS